MKLNTEVYNFNEIFYDCFGSTDSPIMQISSGITYPDKTYEIERFRSPAYSIEYIYSGDGVVQHNNKMFTATAGDIIISHATAYHHYYSNKKNPWKKIWICVNDGIKYTKHLIDAYHLEDVIYVKNFNQPEIFERFFERIRKKDENTLTDLELILHELFASIAKFIAKNQNSEQSDAIILHNWLHQNIGRKITMEDCCNFLGYKKSHVMEIFKNHYGQTPISYYKELKIKRAAELLKNPEYTISEIAEALGFSSPYHFSSVFKKSTGLSPSDYKKTQIIKRGSYTL